MRLRAAPLFWLKEKDQNPSPLTERALALCLVAPPVLNKQGKAHQISKFSYHERLLLFSFSHCFCFSMLFIYNNDSMISRQVAYVNNEGDDAHDIDVDLDFSSDIQ